MLNTTGPLTFPCMMGAIGVISTGSAHTAHVVNNRAELHE